MVRFLILGTIELTAADGTELRSVLAQPKRTALLAYLAAATPRGFHRRDTLISLFWPELDADRARGALNKAVYHLRQALGEGVLVGRGDEELGLDPARFWSDAGALLDALEGMPTDAVELFRGELLQGFHLSGTPEFERWLDQSRDVLKRRVLRTALDLAARDEAAGDARSACHWTRRAVAIDPMDERAVRQLMTILDSVGDRAAAIREYERLARLLKEDLELEPAPETVVLAAAIRTRAGTRGARQAQAPEGGARPVEPRGIPALPTASPAAAEKKATPADRWRSWRYSAVAAAGMAAFLAAGWGAWALSAPSLERRVDPYLVAVLPGAVYGDRYAYLREGLVHLISFKLQGAGELRAVDPGAILNRVRADGALEPEDAQAVAVELGAGLFVLCTAVVAGEAVHLNAALHDSNGERLATESIVARVEAQIPAALDELIARLLSDRPGPPAERFARLGARTTESFVALKEYLQAERLVREWKFDSATSAYQRAITEDSTFALAWYRMSLAIAAGGASPSNATALSAAEQAARFGARLAPSQRGIIDATCAYLRGDITEADAAYRRVLGLSPDELEALRGLGDILLHYGVRRGRPASEARKIYELALKVDSTDFEVRGHLAWVALLEEDFARWREVRQLEPERKGQMIVKDRVLLTFLGSDRSARNSALSELRGLKSLDVRLTAHAAALNGSSRDAAREIASLLLEPLRPNPWQGQGQTLIGRLYLAEGRWSRATVHFRTAAELHAAYAFEHALYAQTPLLAVPRSELLEIRSSAERSTDPRLRYRLFRLYDLGLLDSRLGDAASAKLHADSLRAHARLLATQDSAPQSAFARDLARGVSADILFRAGRLKEALDTLELILVGEGWWPTMPWSPNEAQAHERWLRAELLVALGREREAIDWYAGFGSLDAELGYIAPKHLRLAEVYERLGQPIEARRHYARFIELWPNPDPELQPLVENARVRLAQLAGAR